MTDVTDDDVTADMVVGFRMRNLTYCPECVVHRARDEMARMKRFGAGGTDSLSGSMVAALMDFLARDVAKEKNFFAALPRIAEDTPRGFLTDISVYPMPLLARDFGIRISAQCNRCGTYLD